MRNISRLHSILFAIIAPVWIVLLFTMTRFGVDFEPLYFAGQRVLSGLSPYGADTTNALAAQWPAPFATAGVAYPLQIILLVAPLTWLPRILAVSLWVSIGMLAAFRSVRLASSWQQLVLLPLLFLPLHRSVALGQATLVWFGLAVTMLLAIKSPKPWLVGLTCALLVLKPQNGLLFAMAGLVWSFRHDRRAIWWFVGCSGVLGTVSLLVQPDWPFAWLRQMQIYSEIVRPPTLLPAGLLLVLACWRLPWWARVAAAQVVLFPLSDVYSTVPLLLCWVAIGGPAALFGASITWLWAAPGFPNNMDTVWGLIMCPLLFCAIWRAWVAPRLAHMRMEATSATPKSS
jgi:hypothetical protein